MTLAGSPEATRDWFNASFFNKEEIDRYFLENNSGIVTEEKIVTPAITGPNTSHSGNYYTDDTNPGFTVYANVVESISPETFWWPFKQYTGREGNWYLSTYATSWSPDEYAHLEIYTPYKEGESEQIDCSLSKIRIWQVPYSDGKAVDDEYHADHTERVKTFKIVGRSYNPLEDVELGTFEIPDADQTQYNSYEFTISNRRKFHTFKFIPLTSQTGKTFKLDSSGTILAVVGRIDLIGYEEFGYTPYAYDITLRGFKPNQYLQLVGETSGKIYNVCTNEISGNYWNLFWFAKNETIDVIDVITGEILKSKGLTRRKIVIILSGVAAGFLTTSDTSTFVDVNLDFDPDVLCLKPAFQGLITENLDLSVPRLGSSVGNGVIDEDQYYPNTIRHSDVGFGLRAPTSTWANKKTYYIASDFADVFTAPGVNEDIDIDLGYRPMSIMLRPTGENQKYHYLYESRYMTEPYYNGEGNCNVSVDSSPIVSINDNGFTFRPRNSTQENKQYTYIAAPFEDLGYVINPTYYCVGTGRFAYYEGRSFNKTNDGPAYCCARYINGKSTTPVLISKDNSCIKTNNPSYEHQFEYDGELWWTGGHQYGFQGKYQVPRFIDITEYGPYSTSSAQNYKLACIQIATACLNIILGKDEPIPQSL